MARTDFFTNRSRAGGSRPLEGLSLCFDLDGTLVDTAPDLIRVLNDVIAGEGLPETDFRKARQAVSLGSRRLLTDALQRAEHSVTPKRLDAMQAEFLERYADNIAQHSTPYPGVRETIKTLSKLGAESSVCTNKPGYLARPLMEALGMTGDFKRIIGGDDAPRSKPCASHVYMAAGHRDARRIVMIGDSQPDMGAGRNSGALSVLMTYGYSPSPQIRLRADVRLRTFRALTPALIERFAPTE